MISLITIHQEMEWKRVIQKSLNYDFYHTWYYHKMSKDGEPVLLKYTEGDDFIAFPLLRRNIPNSNFFDMTCVYGYTGPVSNKPFDKICNRMKDGFKAEFLAFLKMHNYVSVFSRLNPFLNQLALMNNFDGVHDNGKMVIIDLREPLEKQRSRYLGNHLKKITKLKRKGFYVREVNTKADIKAFAEIYIENMLHVGACDYYLYSEEYFQRMILSTEFDCKLLMVFHGKLPVCGATIVCTQKVIQFHFLGTLTSYRKYSPSKLLTDEISLLGRKLGMHYFNLGGGYGFKQDSLFDFKTSFSDLLVDFKSWRFIVNKRKYQELTQNANIDPDEKVDFFPLYRYNANKMAYTKKRPLIQVVA